MQDVVILYLADHILGPFENGVTAFLDVHVFGMSLAETGLTLTDD